MELQTFGYRILFVSSKADNELYEFDNIDILPISMVLLSFLSAFVFEIFLRDLSYSVSSCVWF